MGNWFAGEELSRGQWQSIALARAFMRNGDILALDEPTSSLDPISERVIFELLILKSINRIKIIIIHRPENMDIIQAKILLFKEGRIVAEGYHDELISANEEYRKIVLAKDKDKNFGNYEYG